MLVMVNYCIMDSAKLQLIHMLCKHADAVPPKRLNCTVIFVAIEGSQNPAISCAAKIFRGLCLQERRSNSKTCYSERQLLAHACNQDADLKSRMENNPE